jgi:hypothetical protein
MRTYICFYAHFERKSLNVYLSETCFERITVEKYEIELSYPIHFSRKEFLVVKEKEDNAMHKFPILLNELYFRSGNI